MRAILGIVVSVALGAMVGGIASPIIGKRLGVAWCIIIGVVGAFLGGAVIHIFNIGDGRFVTLLFEVGGACLLLLLAYLFGK